MACWCPPLPCHGDVLVELVEQQDPTGKLNVEVVEVPAEPVHGCAGEVCRTVGCSRGTNNPRESGG